MGADYSCYVKSIETHAHVLIIFAIGRVIVQYVCSTMDMIKSNIFIIWSNYYNNEITTHRHGQSEVNGLGNQILLQIENMHMYYAGAAEIPT